MSKSPLAGNLIFHRIVMDQPLSRPPKRPRFGDYIPEETQDISSKVRQAKPVLQRDDCPYLDTIDRSRLDFDSVPICSVTLVSHNVYSCLVCGRFFHGRAPSSPAYAHALHESHHVFLSLATEAFYCLPDDYQILHPSLYDISAAVRPRFTLEDITTLDTTVFKLHLPDRSVRIRGAVSLDALHDTTAATVVLQLVLKPAPVRNALLLHDPHADLFHPIQMCAVQNSLAQITKAIWASHAFRPQVAPHVFMQIFGKASTAQAALASNPTDPVSVLAWLLNTCSPRKLQKDVSSSARELASFFRGSFSGMMTVVDTFTDTKLFKEAASPFWFLPLDLPPKPLFKHQSDRDIVPQISLEALLSKFNGETSSHIVQTGASRTFRISYLPPFLFLVIRRFSKSKFGAEKNPCVVHLPSGVLDLANLWSRPSFGSYRLIAVVSHQGPLEKGQFRVSVYHDACSSWFDVSNVSVEPTLFQIVSLTDTYILLYAKVEVSHSSTPKT